MPRSKKNDISPEMRLGIFRRDSNRCCRCGKATDLTLQHRMNKQMGGLGSKAERLSWFDGITLCFTCNTAIESRADAQQEAILSGWKVPRKSFLPTRLIPVYYAWQKSWNFLHGDGLLGYCPPTIGAGICKEVYDWTS